MKQGLIAPSMMCVDFSEMTSVIEAFEKNGIGYLHIDIMDGEFVPNYTLGTDFCTLGKYAAYSACPSSNS